MKRYIVLLFTALIMGGCIENDIPYPVINGVVTKMEIEGQTDLKIDPTKYVINVTLADTIDLRKVNIKSMQFTEESRSTLDSGDVIDLTDGVTYAIAEKPYGFTISTFQDYPWQIIATQPIEREVAMSGIIGKASFDFENKVIVIKVAQSQDLYDITVENFKIGPSNATYTPDPRTICDYSRPVKVVMSVHDVQEEWSIEVEHSFENVITGKANAWAHFAFLEGDVLPTSTDEPAFEFKESGVEKWSEIKATNKSGKIAAVATPLKPNTKYVFRARLGGEYGAEVEFQTETAPVLPNLNFEDAYSEDRGTTPDGKKKIAWYFNMDGGNSFWATGNDGTMTSPGQSTTTSVSGSDAVAGKAVRMETFTGVAMVKVAAGNLYTGTFAKSLNMSDPIKNAVMGRPYKGRPTTFKGWYRYSPKPVSDYYNKYGNFDDSIGKMDWCHIYITLEKWPEGAEVRPAENLITKVAYGEFRTNTEVPTYTQFNTPITYYSLTDRPTHIVLTATSSVNGGLFCGGGGSVLYVDEFELSFDYIGSIHN